MVNVDQQHNLPTQITLYYDIMCSMSAPHFSTVFHKRQDFQKKVIEHKMRFLFCLKIISERFLFLKRIQRVPKCTLCKVNVILVRCKRKRILFENFCKSSQITLVFDIPSSGSRDI